MNMNGGHVEYIKICNTDSENRENIIRIGKIL